MNVQAFAEAWAEAIVCKDQCSVEVDTAADSIGSVLATSVTEAYGNVCAGACPELSVHTRSKDGQSCCHR